MDDTFKYFVDHSIEHNNRMADNAEKLADVQLRQAEILGRIDANTKELVDRKDVIKRFVPYAGRALVIVMLIIAAAFGVQGAL